MVLKLHAKQHIRAPKFLQVMLATLRSDSSRLVYSLWEYTNNFNVFYGCGAAFYTVRKNNLEYLYLDCKRKLTKSGYVRFVLSVGVQ